MRDTIKPEDCNTGNTKQFDEMQELVLHPHHIMVLEIVVREENQIGQEQTPDDYIDQLVNVFRSVSNVLTDDGTLWVNLGDSYYNYRLRCKGQGLPRKLYQKQNKTYQMCVIKEVINSKDLKKKI